MSNIKWIKGYEKLYKITPTGSVISYMESKPRVLSNFYTTTGYIAVNIYPTHNSANTTKKQKIVANILLETYGPPKPTPKHKVRYIDGDRTNIKLSNLTWVTQQELSTINFEKIRSKMKKPRKPVIVVIDGVNNAGKLLKDNIQYVIDKNPTKTKKRDYLVFTPEGYEEWKTKGYNDPANQDAQYR